MAFLTVLLMLVCANIPVWAYAWMYQRWYNLVAGVLYFALFLGLAVLSSKLVEQKKNGPSGEIFGLAVMFFVLPGIYLAIWVVVPFLQLTQGDAGARGISVGQVSEHREANFFSFTDAVVRGDLQHWSQQRRSRRNGESTSTWTAHFQVAPVVLESWTPSEGSPVVWLASDVEDGLAFRSGAESPSNLSGLVLVKADKGYQRAVTEACQKAGLAECSEPLLLSRTPPYSQIVAQTRERLALWLGLYNGLVLFLTVGYLFTSRGRSRSEKGRTGDPEEGERP
jgi:hypothetical protein